jgi:hypothetical protein
MRKEGFCENGYSGRYRTSQDLNDHAIGPIGQVVQVVFDVFQKAQLARPTSIGKLPCGMGGDPCGIGE